MPTITAIHRYPVKGLSAEVLPRVALKAGEVIPFDRAYAIENGPSGFDPEAPRTLPKTHFLMLMRNEHLAELDTRFDDRTTTLTIRHDGGIVAQGRLDEASGRRAIETFFDVFSVDDLRGPAKILAAPGFSFSDTSAKVVSLINLETVRALGRELGVDVHPLRFRGNLHVDGLPAWEEFNWIGARLVAGGVAFEVAKRIDRCAATNVNPLTAERDLAIPRSLLEIYGHADCGVYLRVVSGGELAAGDTLTPA